MNDRQRDKHISRENDEARMLSGEATPAQIQAENGFFSVLDRSKARLVARRVKINLRGAGHEV